MYPHAPKHLRKGLNSPGNLGELLCLSLFFMRLAGRSLVTFLICSFRFLDACWHESRPGINEERIQMFSESYSVWLDISSCL